MLVRESAYAGVAGPVAILSFSKGGFIIEKVSAGMYEKDTADGVLTILIDSGGLIMDLLSRAPLSPTAHKYQVSGPFVVMEGDKLAAKISYHSAALGGRLDMTAYIREG